MKFRVAIACAIAAATLHAQAPIALGARGRINANVSLAASGAFVAVVRTSANDQGDEDIEAALSRDGGATFAPAARVNTTADSARTNGEQPPRVALLPGSGVPAIVVVWTAKGTGGTRLVSARSNDSGRTFTAEAVVPGSEAAGNRGWESVAVDPGGHVHVLWLDHRDAVASSADASHQKDHNLPMAMQSDAVVRAQLSNVYSADLDDPHSGHSLAAGVCYCCKTALGVSPDGSLNAAWRHVYPGDVRDIAFARSVDGGRTFSQPVRVSEDKWAIDGCPENGPALAVAADRVVHLAWPTLVGVSGGTRTAVFISRNSGTGPDFFSVNARLGRTFHAGSRTRIEVMAEGFNLTNRENVVTYNGNFGGSSYAGVFAPAATAVGDPRAFQLALRASF